MSAFPSYRSLGQPKIFLLYGIVFSCSFCLGAQEPSAGPSQQETKTQPATKQTSASGVGPQALELKLQRPIKRELKGGETDRYEIRLKKGQFLRLVAEQEGIDVVLVLSDPGKKVLVQADSPNGNWGPEPASLIATSSGIFHAQVKSLDKNAAAGKYTITIAELRQPKPEDQTRIAAETALFAAAASATKTGDQSTQKTLELYEKARSLWRSLRDPYEEALCAYSLGLARSVEGESANYKQAMDDYSRALMLVRQTGDRRMEATILNSLGRLHNDHGEKEQALDYLNQAAALQHTLGDARGEAKALRNLGRVYDVLGEKRKALDYWNQALPLERGAGDQTEESATLNDIGGAYSQLGENEKAFDYLNKALSLTQKLGDQRDEAEVLTNIGHVYFTVGEMQKALEIDERALSLERTAGNRSGLAVVLNNLCTVHASLGEMQKAVEYCNQALAEHRAAGDRSGQTETLINIGVLYTYQGQNEKALEYFEEARTLNRAAGDRTAEATTLQNIGGVYADLGEKQKALEYFNQALPIERAIGNRQDEANTLNSIGGIYSLLGELQKALEHYLQALALQRAVDDRAGEATTLNNIGTIYDDLGEKQKAIEYYNQSLPLRRAAGDRSGEATSLNNIGYVYSELGEKQKALERFQQALALRRAIEDRAGEATVLNNIGGIYITLGEKQKALEQFQQALALRRAVGDHEGEAITLTNIANAYFKLGEKQTALEYLDQALPLARAVQDPISEGIILENMMGYWKAEKNPSLAIFFGKQSVNVYQQIRRNIQGLEAGVQKSFLESKASAYRDLGDLLIAQGRLGEAQQVLDLLKEEEYFEFVRGEEHAAGAKSKAIPLNPEEQSSREAYEKIAGQISAAGVEYSELRAKRSRTPEEEAHLAELKEKLTVANQEMGRFFKTLYVEFGKNAQANQVAENIREQAGGMQSIVRELGPGTVALYTLVGESRYSVIVITASTMQAREYPIAATDLRRKVATFLEALKNPTSDPLPASQDLYKILVEPIANDLKGAKARTLMWSLNDALRYVPMAALHDGKQYLVESYRNVVITPASTARLKDKVDVEKSSIAAMGVSKDYDGLGPLPAVPGELEHIVRDEKSRGAGGVLPGTLMLDDDFTESEMAKALDKHYPVVHIASHFVLQAGNETNSYLLLGGKEVGGKGYHLTLAELRDDPTLAFDGTELLTLSACQTGASGAALNGREVDGLGITAQQKGAKAVLASLWNVADESTAVLMADFYKQWLGTPGITKVGALRQAQLNMLHGASGANDAGAAPARGTENGADKKAARSYTHPFYWGGFILIGNWK